MYVERTLLVNQTIVKCFYKLFTVKNINLKVNTDRYITFFMYIFFNFIQIF
jgi:hypothetical protein